MTLSSLAGIFFSRQELSVRTSPYLPKMTPSPLKIFLSQRELPPEHVLEHIEMLKVGDDQIEELEAGSG